jgi:hypothetical protein
LAAVKCDDNVGSRHEPSGTDARIVDFGVVITNPQAYDRQRAPGFRSDTAIVKRQTVAARENRAMQPHTVGA